MHSLEASRLRKFHYCKPDSLSFRQRVERIGNRIRESTAGIACLQELDDNILLNLGESLKDQYLQVAVALNENIPSKDGVGIFVDPTKFDLIDSKTVRFRDVLDTHLPTLGQSARSDETSVSLTRALDREVREKMNMAVMAKLKHIDTQNVFIACSAHLFWDPSYPDIKLIQSYLLSNELRVYSEGISRIVLGADLNSVPISSGVYELLMGSGSVEISHAHHPVTLRSTKGSSVLKSISEEAVSALHCPVPFVSAYRAINAVEPLFTNYTQNFKGCLDYIMLKGFTTLDVRALPSQEELQSETALPNSHWPSDHLPLVADISFDDCLKSSSR